MPSEFAVRLRRFTSPTAEAHTIPHQTLTFNATRDGGGTVNLTVSELVAGSLPTPFYAGIEVRNTSGKWVKPRNNLYTFHEKDGDARDATGIRNFTGVLWVADRAGMHLVDPTMVVDGGITWVNASAGGVLADLLTRLSGHGITRSFTPAVDSSGAAWPAADKTDQTAGLWSSVSSVLSQLASGGYCDWYTEGTELVLLRARTGTDRSNTIPIGANSASVNVKESTAETATKFYIVSDQDGVPIQVVTRPDLGAGPRQAVVNVSGATTADAALRMAQPLIDAASQVRREITVVYEAALLPATPFVDFNIGDDFGFPEGKYRLVGIQVSRAEKTTVTLTFGEIILDLTAKLAKRVAQISIGTVNMTGGSGAPIPPGVVLPAAEPAAPTGLTVQSNVGTVDPSGRPYAAIRLAWAPVTKTALGADTRVTQYEVWASLPGSNQVPIGRTTEAELTADWDAVPRSVTVRAFNGRWSEFSAPLQVVPAQPEQILTAPSLPHLESMMGVVIVSWDGTLVSGDDMPAQFSQLVAESAPEATGPWTRVGAPLTQAGQVGAVRGEPGLPVFVRFAWVDTSGRVSDYSELAEIAIVGVLPENLESISDFFANEAIIAVLKAGILTVGAIEVDMIAPNLGELINLEANEGIQILTGRIEATEQMGQYYRFGPDGAIIGREDDPTKFIMRNDGASFEVNGVPATTWGPEGMDVPRLVSDIAVLGNHQFEKSGDRTIVRWAGES